MFGSYSTDRFANAPDLWSYDNDEEEYYDENTGKTMIYCDGLGEYVDKSIPEVVRERYDKYRTTDWVEAFSEYAVDKLVIQELEEIVFDKYLRIVKFIGEDTEVDGDGIITAKELIRREMEILDEPMFAIDANSRKITVPDEFTGDIMGDLNKRRGRVLGMTPTDTGKQTVIEAEIPESTIYGYSTDLRSMTGGMGDFSYEFNRYEQAPGDVQAQEIEARKDKLVDSTED